MNPQKGMPTMANQPNLCSRVLLYTVTWSRKPGWREQSQPVISFAWSWMRRFSSSFSVFSNEFCSFSSDTSYRDNKIFDPECSSSFISSSNNDIFVVTVQIPKLFFRDWNWWTKFYLHLQITFLKYVPLQTLLCVLHPISDQMLKLPWTTPLCHVFSSKVSKM